MEQIENGIFEKKYRSSGCLFAILGTLMAGLLLICILASLDQAKTSQFQWEGIPLFLVLGCIAYFCFSRCFTRTLLGIYPTCIIMDNKKLLWPDVKHITLQKGEKWCNIFVELKSKRHIRRNIIVLAILVIGICIPLIIVALTIPTNVAGMGKISGILFILPAMFGINIGRPLSQETSIEPKDSETVFHLLKYYADIHQIPLEYKEEKK